VYLVASMVADSSQAAATKFANLLSYHLFGRLKPAIPFVTNSFTALGRLSGSLN